MKGRPIVKVGIYLRKSRAEDGTQDLAKHKKYLIEVAERNGWSYELYEEIESSQALVRPELQRLRQDIGLDKIDAVMVHAVDRLSRKQRHFLEIMEDYFVEQGMTTLYVKDTEYDLTDTTTVTMLQIQATMSQAEYSFIVNRLNEGRKASVKQGVITGKIIYGYEYDKETRKIKPHPEESKLVRKITDMLLEGESYKGICDKLNTLGYRTRKGNLWDIHNIKSIAHSPIIRGHVIQQWKDEQIEVKNSHEALITDAEYAKIKQILDDRAKNYKSLSKAPKHYLQGLLRCPNCKRVMTIAGSKPKRSKLPDGTLERSGDYVYYIRACRPYVKQKEKCGNNGCQAVVIEDAIRELVKSYKHQVEQTIKELLETDAKEIKNSKKSDVDALKRAITKLESKEEPWLDMIGDDDAPVSQDVIFKQVAKIKDEKAELMEQLRQAEEQYSAVDIEQEIKHQSNIVNSLEKWDDLSDEQKRQTLQMTFKEIWYSRFDKDEPPELDVVLNGYE
ncbi:recombinase family protein [Bacillaceae bacterium SIJ1]|uniref:recombinase family protein n=1 Tax=Litoribacterium kuwaitense TaxID=1398745 RepID=UPI0013EC14B4|nr:recombinase family protein [Litoribacterium kuwaitense]NGP44850.1 recombinase family protein [Litoribacterium kuwaitense]